SSSVLSPTSRASRRSLSPPRSSSAASGSAAGTRAKEEFAQVHSSLSDLAPLHLLPLPCSLPPPARRRRCPRGRKLARGGRATAVHRRDHRFARACGNPVRGRPAIRTPHRRFRRARGIAPRRRALPDAGRLAQSGVPHAQRLVRPFTAHAPRLLP